jgi:hypothetical protein
MSKDIWKISTCRKEVTGEDGLMQDETEAELVLRIFVEEDLFEE